MRTKKSTRMCAIGTISSSSSRRASLVFFGLTLLQTFVLFYFRDVQKRPIRRPAPRSTHLRPSAAPCFRVSCWGCSRIARRARSSLRCAGGFDGRCDDRLCARARAALDAAVCRALRHRLWRRAFQRLGDGDGRDSQAARRRARSRSLEHRDEPAERRRTVGGRLAHRSSFMEGAAAIKRFSGSRDSALRSRRSRCCAHGSPADFVDVGRAAARGGGVVELRMGPPGLSSSATGARFRAGAGRR